jgi:hypothetical protein
MRKTITVLISVLLAAVILQGCSSTEDPTGPAAPAAPELPSLSTMKMDISFFEAADVPPQAVQAGVLGEDRAALGAGARRLNFLNAAVRVLYLEVVVYSALVDPVAAFALAAHSIPQQQPDGSYLWTYIVKEGALEYSIFLYGKDLGDVVSWRMEVSSNDPAMPFDHFVWFDGEVKGDESGGYWQFYTPAVENPANAAVTAYATPGEKVIRIDWADSGDTGQLIFTVNRPGDPAEGSALSFYESAEYCSVEFFDMEAGTNGTIRWNKDGSGYIEWPDYHDSERRCWDTIQCDVDCGI